MKKQAAVFVSLFTVRLNPESGWREKYRRKKYPDISIMVYKVEENCNGIHPIECDINSNGNIAIKGRRQWSLSCEIVGSKTAWGMVVCLL